MVGRQRLLFLALGHLSNGDISIAADFARQLPTAAFEVVFVTAPVSAAYVQALGLTARPLTGQKPYENVAALDEITSDYRPHAVIAADAFTLDYSQAWSGLTMELLRQRYDTVLASFDQYDYPAADYLVDFYPQFQIPFPRLLDGCDLLIRNSPLNRPAPNEPGIIVTRVTDPGGPPPAMRRPGQPPTVFITNSHWESVNVVQSLKPIQLMRSIPPILHSHLAALERPIRVVHVGPVKWEFPVAPQIEYHHIAGLEPAEFHARLAEADLFLTCNAVSITLTKAVFAGVPSLLLDNDATLRVSDVSRQSSEHAWLADAAPELTTAYPFRVAPWGWHQFLEPVLADNPYTDCFLTAGLLHRPQVLAAMTALLDDPETRSGLAVARNHLLDQLNQLPPAAEALRAELDRLRTGRA